MFESFDVSLPNKLLVLRRVLLEVNGIELLVVVLGLMRLCIRALQPRRLSKRLPKLKLILLRFCLLLLPFLLVMNIQHIV